MIRYVFREPLALKNADKASPQKIGEALADIAEAHSGRLTPGDVVEAARNKRSPLNPHFEWNDAAAAEQYRLDQARSLIRVVRVEDDTDEPKRAYISIGDADGVSYRSLGEVQASTQLQLIVLKQAGRDLSAWRKRYRELADLCESVRVVEEQVSARLREAETRA
jgi:hypothetical protein